MTTRIQLRRDTAVRWSSINPVLAAGEPAVESDTGKLKVGDGTTAWSALPYILDVSDLTPVIEDLVAAASPAPYTDEQVRDVVSAAIVSDGDFIAVTVSDPANTVRFEPGAALTEVGDAVSGRLSDVALRAAFGRAAPVLSNFSYDSATGNLLSYQEDGITITLTYNADGTVATSERGDEPVQTYSYSGGNLVGVA